MKVRIGNDIRLNLTLKSPKTYDEKNIKELRCYLVNTSVTKCFGLDPHCPLAHHDHICGCHRYHHLPHAYDKMYTWDLMKPIPLGPCCDDHHDCCCCGDHCCHHEKYPFSPCDPAMGQGPLPPKYHRNCCCANYCKFGPHDHMSNCFDREHDMYEDWHPSMPDHIDHLHCEYNNPAMFAPHFVDYIAPYTDGDFKYLAQSRVLHDKNKIQVYFPAYDQYMCGDYKLVIVMVAFEAGWGRQNLHTYTIDYGNVLTLVDDDSAIDGSITIDVDKDSLIDCNVSRMETVSEYTMLVGDELRIGNRDFNGQTYKILVELANGGSTEFDPNNWDYGSIKFYSDDPSIVTVDENTGVLVATPTSGDKETTINVFSGTICTSFKVKVIGSGSDYIVFIPSNNVEDVRKFINGSKMFEGGRKYEYDNIFGTHDLVNPSDENFMWICSRKRIGDSNSTSSHVRISMFDVPLLPAKMRPADNLYYYMCPNKLVQTETFDITVER